MGDPVEMEVWVWRVNLASELKRGSRVRAGGEWDTGHTLLSASKQLCPPDDALDFRQQRIHLCAVKPCFILTFIAGGNFL